MSIEQSEKITIDRPLSLDSTDYGELKEVTSLG